MWRRREKTGTALYDESGCNTDMTRRSPGCGSSLLPPLAAVVAVASGLTDGSRAVSPTKRKAPLEVATPRGFFLFGVTVLTFDIPDFRIPDPPQKSSAVQKVYNFAHTPGTSSLRASSRRAVPSGRSLAASIWPGETW